MVFCNTALPLAPTPFLFSVVVLPPRAPRAPGLCYHEAMADTESRCENLSHLKN